MGGRKPVLPRSFVLDSFKFGFFLTFESLFLSWRGVKQGKTSKVVPCEGQRQGLA